MLAQRTFLCGKLLCAYFFGSAESCLYAAPVGAALNNALLIAAFSATALSSTSSRKFEFRVSRSSRSINHKTMAVRAYGWSGGSEVRTYGKKNSSSSGSAPFATALEFSPPHSNTLRAGAPSASESVSGQTKPKVSTQKPEPVSCCSLANLPAVPAVRRKPAATPTPSSSRKRQRGTESTSTSTGTASKRSATKSSKKGQQLFLDYGQKSFGKREQCPLCGMLWVKGDVADEAQHASFCTAASQGVAFPGWKKERVVERWPAEEGAPRVVEVRCSDAAPHVSKLEEVKVLMDSDMGFSHAAMQVRLQCSKRCTC
jgi:zinc-finger of acetyl-transferase ESCO